MHRLILPLLTLASCAPSPREVVAERCAEVALGAEIAAIADAKESYQCCVFKAGQVNEFAAISIEEAGPALDLQCCALRRNVAGHCSLPSECPAVTPFLIGEARHGPGTDGEAWQSCCCAYVIDGQIAARHVTGQWTNARR